MQRITVYVLQFLIAQSIICAQEEQRWFYEEMIAFCQRCSHDNSLYPFYCDFFCKFTRRSTTTMKPTTTTSSTDEITIIA
ncbi:hypothetical protein Trydic_g2016 [Trypoxylus dichotomus]